MNIYLSTETSFENNGLGFLADCIEATVDESLNGDYVLNLTYPLNGKLNEYLVEGNIIKSNVGNDNYQLFRIVRVNKDFNEIEVYALHISYDLLTNMLVDTYPQNLGCQAFGQWLFDHTQYTSGFTFQSDINTAKSARYVRRNPIEAIMGDLDNSMINIFGGEVERDNFTFKLLQSRGQNNHVKLMFGKNITEIKTIVDITSMFTRIMPIGYDGLLLPEKFIDSPLINNYPTPRITKVEFSDIKYDPESTEEGVYTDIEDAYQALRDATQKLFVLGIDKPQITIKIDWLELSKTEQYKNQYQALETVRLGDTITASLLDFDYTTKVVRTTYNVLTDSIDKFEIGTIQKSIASTINQNQYEIQQIQPDSILDEAKQNATNLINNALGGYIYLDYETGNLYIMDTDDPSTAQKVWRWNLNGLGYSSTGVNGTYGIAMTMDGQIVADYITTGTLNTNVISGYGTLTAQVQTNKEDIATIKAEISDIADITTSSTDETAFIPDTELQNIAVSNPIRVEIHPIGENISYLYPSTSTYPSDLLYPKIRDLKFTNTSTNEVFTYTLPQNLLYYDSDNYDTFVADYETDTITITKKCGWNPNGDGSVILLQEPVITEYSFTDTFAPHFNLTEGNYQVELPGYSVGYIMVRLMVLNAYTAQYATKIELNNAITLTTTEVSAYVDAQITDVNGEIDEVRGDLSLKLGKNEYGQLISMLNAAADEITLAGGSKINLTTAGKLLISAGNFILDASGNITANNATLTNVDIQEGNITLTSTNDNVNVINIKSTDNKNNSYMSAYGHTSIYANGSYNGYASMATNASYSFMNLEHWNSITGGNTMYINMSDSSGQLALNAIDGGQNPTATTEIEPNRIYTTGNMYAQSFIPSSLEKNKKDIEEYKKSALDIINDTDIYSFHYKNENKKDKKHIGFIIGDNYNYSKEITSDKNDGVDLYSFVSVCCKAIQEQQKEIDQLKKEIDILKGGK